MLCQHLGFEAYKNNSVENRQLESKQQIATGDLICYTTKPNNTSCCVYLKSSLSSEKTAIPYVKCKYDLRQCSR